MTQKKIAAAVAWITGIALAITLALPNGATAATFYNNDSPDGLMATASHSGGLETESADDFIVSSPTQITSATFTGLLPIGAPLSIVSDVGVEIYRVFPLDSTNPPSGNVPTRANSPSDVAFDSRDSASASLTFTTSLLNPNFTAANSAVNGINPIPNQTTGGEGPVTGQEVQFTVTFATPFNLPANHYFFVPQVDLTSGTFLWLSAPKPAALTPFAPDLQAWIRNGNLEPDWLRVGTDIVGAGTFNSAFSLSTATPEPSSFILCGLGAVGLLVAARRRRKA